MSDLNAHQVSVLMAKVTEYLSVKFRDTAAVLNDNAVLPTRAAMMKMPAVVTSIERGSRKG